MLGTQVGASALLNHFVLSLSLTEQTVPRPWRVRLCLRVTAGGLFVCERAAPHGLLHTALQGHLGKIE